MPMNQYRLCVFLSFFKIFNHKHLSLLINFMAYKLREQKYQPYSSRTREHSPQACINQIEGTTQKFRMLINSFKERSLKEDSLGNDSEFSKQDLLAQSRSFREDKNRRKHKQRLHQLYNCPGLGRDIGDAALANRPIRHLHLINNMQVSRLISKGHQQSHQKINDSTKEQSLNFEHQNRKINQLQNKQSQLMSSPEKKHARFRITQKIEQRKTSLNGLSRNKHLNAEKEEEFQVLSIDAYLIVSHLNSIRDLDIDSNPEQIFTFFQSIYNIGRFPSAEDPVIKRYRNCIYYGERPNADKSSSYIGMVWYFKKSLYYGQLLDSKKHGNGIEIQVSKQPLVWKGKFEKGQKTGYFCVESNELKYYGMLKNGQYHGQGHLITTSSEYKGAFCQGLKEGRGWEKMSNKTQYKGEYFNNKFDGEGELKAKDYYYKGMFKFGKPDGRGFERTELYQYLGEFVMGVKQGKGKIKTKDGITMECRFWNGLAVDDNLQVPKSSKQVLEPHLSKHLGSLNEQSQEGTIEHVLQAISRS